MRVYKKRIERITITFANNEEDRGKAFKYCLDNDYRITRSGPRRIGSSHEYDTTKGVIIAEREERAR